MKYLTRRNNSNSSKINTFQIECFHGRIKEIQIRELEVETGEMDKTDIFNWRAKFSTKNSNIDVVIKVGSEIIESIN